MITYFIAAVALVIHKSDTNRAAIFLFCLFFSIAQLIALDTSETYFLWSIMSTAAFIVGLSMLSRSTWLVLLLATTDIILALIDLIALVSYNLGNEWLFQLRFPMTYYVSIAQVACLLVVNERTVNFSSIRYNLSLYIDNTKRFFVHREKIH